jgi:flagellar export protein FliJ
MTIQQTFRLQPVLNYTESLVDNLELEFAELKVAQHKELRIQEELQHAQKSQLDSLHQQQQEGVLDCEAILLHQRYLDTLDSQIKRQKTRVAQATALADAKREELITTIKDQRTLDKLRQNFVAAQKLDLNRREARAIDELVITQYARKR